MYIVEPIKIRFFQGNDDVEEPEESGRRVEGDPKLSSESDDRELKRHQRMIRNRQVFALALC